MSNEPSPKASRARSTKESSEPQPDAAKEPLTPSSNGSIMKPSDAMPNALEAVGHTRAQRKALQRTRLTEDQALAREDLFRAESAGDLDLFEIAFARLGFSVLDEVQLLVKHATGEKPEVSMAALREIHKRRMDTLKIGGALVTATEQRKVSDDEEQRIQSVSRIQVRPTVSRADPAVIEQVRDGYLRPRTPGVQDVPPDDGLGGDPPPPPENGAA